MKKGDNMYRLKDECNYTLEIEKSRFICYAQKCFNESEAKKYIQSIKKLHPNATHHCYAFIIGEHNEMQRSSDDGEPSGTAGVPMLEALRKNQMEDTVCVCVRYFGGIKLGTGGLIRAYSKSVSLCLTHAIKTHKILVDFYTLTFSYDLIGKLDYLFLQEKITITDKKYNELVTYTFYCLNDEIISKISELTNGSYLPQFIEKKIIEVLE